MLTRRALMAIPAAVGLSGSLRAQTAATKRMYLAIHQNTSRGAGFRGSLEGWARADVRHVELTDRLLDEFLSTDTLAAANRLLSDLDLTPVSAAAVLPDLWLPGPARSESLD